MTRPIDPSWRPDVPSVWEDAEGRELTVHVVSQADRLGRQVRGHLVYPDGTEADYATDLRTFVAVWVERRPRVLTR